MMSLEIRTYSVLVVSASETFNQSLLSFFSAGAYSPAHFVSDISTAKRAFAERDYDFVIINAPLPDDPGMRFAVDVCSGKATAVLVLIKNEIYAEANRRLSESGVFTVPKPISRQTLVQALYWLSSARELLRKFEKKTVSIEEKMEEIRLVNRAKWLLINELKLSEPDAHRYIEKQAMDRCVSKKDVACEIIRKYS